jgi:hypothetical protein
MVGYQEQVHIVPLSWLPPACSQHTGSLDHICFAVADVKPKGAVSLARESLAAYQKLQDMSGMLLSRFGLRTLAGSYELSVAGRRRILDLDTLAADCTYAVSESMAVEVAAEASKLQPRVGPHCMLSQHALAVAASGLRKCA